MIKDGEKMNSISVAYSGMPITNQYLLCQLEGLENSDIVIAIGGTLGAVQKSCWRLLRQRNRTFQGKSRTDIEPSILTLLEKVRTCVERRLIVKEC